MDSATKNILALQQIENCLSLLKDNEYSNYMCGKLYGIKYELERQINNHAAKHSAVWQGWSSRVQWYAWTCQLRLWTVHHDHNKTWRAQIPRHKRRRVQAILEHCTPSIRVSSMMKYAVIFKRKKKQNVISTQSATFFSLEDAIHFEKNLPEHDPQVIHTETVPLF